MLQALAIAPTQGRLGPLAPVPLRDAVAAYLESACRPLLSLPDSAVPELHTHVRRLAVIGHDARTQVLAALGSWLAEQSDEEKTSLMSGLETVLGEAAGRADGVFHPDAAGCLGLGLRATQRAMRRVLVRERQVAAALEAGAESGFTAALTELTGWLDLASSSVLWFLQDEAGWMNRNIAEAACLAVKLLGVRYAAVLDVALRPMDRVREGRAFDLPPADSDWDQQQAVQATASLLNFIDLAPNWDQTPGDA